jgi:hypothetical protein
MTQQFLDARRRDDWFCNRESCNTLFGDCPYRKYCQSNYDDAVRQEMFELALQPHTEFDSFGDVQGETPLYQESRQKDMGPDNPHYHWDRMETLSYYGEA